jgi:hypothetical protein
MSITLDRLKDYECQVPDRGQISLAVARHQSQVWPSEETYEYARERSVLLHRLVDDLGVKPITWGETDKQYPREVVEIVVPIVAALIPVIGDALMMMLQERSKGKENPSVPGFTMTRSDGAKLIVTFPDGKRGRRKEMLRVITAFMTEAVDEEESDPRPD